MMSKMLYQRKGKRTAGVSFSKFGSRFSVWMAFLLSALLFFAAGCEKKENPAPNTSNTVTVTDLAGREVLLANPLQRITALAGPAYEKVFLLGAKDRLAGAHFYTIDRPWVRETNPSIAAVTPVRSPAEPNIETLLSLQTDCVFFWDYSEPLQNMGNAGIPVVVVQNSTGNPKNSDEFILYQKREIGVFADALGKAAQNKAADWYAYFDEKIAYIKERTKAIPPSQRKTAIYAWGEEGLGLFSEYSYVSYWIELAGGRNIADETHAEMDTVVNIEQILRWNPDVIFMGRMDSTAPVLDNPAWSMAKAVQNNNVYLCPDGVMFWDYSSEGVLLMQFLAKKMYPELFADLDMVAETQRYYKRFYDYDLSAENAERLLNHEGPKGD